MSYQFAKASALCQHVPTQRDFAFVQDVSGLGPLAGPSEIVGRFGEARLRRNAHFQRLVYRNINQS